MALDEITITQALMTERAKLLAYIWSIVHDAHLVEDVFQEVSLLAIRKRGELRDKEALGTWLRRSARLIAIDTVRRDAKRPMLFSDEMLDNLDVCWAEFDAAPAAETLHLLERCMTGLSLRFRQMIALRYVNRLSSKEIAEKLDMTTDSVYVAFARIHRALRECIERRRASQEASDD